MHLDIACDTRISQNGFQLAFNIKCVLGKTGLPFDDGTDKILEPCDFRPFEKEIVEWLETTLKPTEE